MLAQPQCLVDAVSTFALASSNFDEVLPLLMSNTVTIDGSNSSMHLDSDLQRIVDSVNLTTEISSRAIESTDIGTRLQELEQMLSDMSESAETDMLGLSQQGNEEGVDAAQTNLMIQKQLVVVTLLMLTAKASLASGRPGSAIKFLHVCRIQCKVALKYVRFASKLLQRVDFDDVAIQVEAMLTMCFERSALSFSFLGIRRKAEDNALLAGKKQKALNMECQSFIQLTMKDLITSIKRHGRHECFLHPLRSLMKMKALSSYVDDLTSGVNLKFPDEASGLEHLLCEAKNALACESRDVFRFQCF